jgi:hypothetical protein
VKQWGSGAAASSVLLEGRRQQQQRWRTQEFEFVARVGLQMLYNRPGASSRTAVVVVIEDVWLIELQ